MFFRTLGNMKPGKTGGARHVIGVNNRSGDESCWRLH
jgi:hypothetical protein